MLSQEFQQLVENPPARGAAFTDRLRKLKLDLTQLPKDEAAEVLLGFLRSGQNSITSAPWRNEWTVGLKSWPTVRLFALDMLGLIDPIEASRFSEVIFAQMGSPDEWALALRNSYMGGGTSQEIDQRIIQYLSRSAWIENPTSGYLEGFDVATVGAPEAALPIFLRMQNDEEVGRAIQFAARLAAERIAENTSIDALRSLANKKLNTDAERLLRAELLAKTDPLLATSHSVITDYLINPSREPKELMAFLRRFPDLSKRISPNLLTSSKALSLERMRSADLAAADLLGNIAMKVSSPGTSVQLLASKDRILSKLGISKL